MKQLEDVLWQLLTVAVHEKESPVTIDRRSSTESNQFFDDSFIVWMELDLVRSALRPIFEVGSLT